MQFYKFGMGESGLVDRNEAEERMQIVGPFQKNHSDHRAEIRKQSAGTNSKLLTAHQFAFAAVISFQNRIQGKKYHAKDAQTKGRMSLVAQFIQGVDIAETSISEGLYAQAENLLKQELVTLAAIEEFEIKARRDGRAPKFLRRLAGFGRRYGEYNEVAQRQTNVQIQTDSLPWR